MYAILILSVLGAATAAPHYHHHHNHRHLHGPPGPPPPYPGFGEDLFDTRTFWDELAKEMQQIDEMLKDFYAKFPSSVSREGIEGDYYKIVIPLSGYKEKEIAVKAREGVLMVQAVQKNEDGNQRSYIDVRTLPENIDLSGSWTYDDEILNIQFRLKPNISTEPPTTDGRVHSDESVEESKEHSREEVSHDNDNVQDVDVGARGDNVADINKNTEIFTNEIPDRITEINPDKNSFEATTYAVDLKNEVEFVPVSY